MLMSAFPAHGSEEARGAILGARAARGKHRTTGGTPGRTRANAVRGRARQAQGNAFTTLASRKGAVRRISMFHTHQQGPNVTGQGSGRRLMDMGKRVSVFGAGVCVAVLCGVLGASPAFAASCSSSTGYKSGLNIRVQARDQDPVFRWQFTKALTKQRKEDDDDAEKVSTKVQDLENSYKTVYSDRLIPSSKTSNKNVVTKVYFEGPVPGSSGSAEYECVINWKTSQKSNGSNRMRFIDASCSSKSLSRPPPVKCSANYNSDPDRFTVKFSLDDSRAK
jgi:hypothetical protein